jgi:hypothetical protein
VRERKTAESTRREEEQPKNVGDSEKNLRGNAKRGGIVGGKDIAQDARTDGNQGDLMGDMGGAYKKNLENNASATAPRGLRLIRVLSRGRSDSRSTSWADILLFLFNDRRISLSQRPLLNGKRTLLYFLISRTTE